MANRTNIFDDLPADLSSEVLETLLQSNHIRIERIISRGQASPEGFWYDQDENEWVILLQGAAEIAFEDHRQELLAGDYVYIPAHQKHRIAWTHKEEITIWLAIFFA